MAKAKRATSITLSLPAGKVEELDLSEIEAQLPDRSASVQLYRQNEEEPTKWDYVGRMGASDFTLEAVKDEYGGGDYRGHLLDENGKFTGKRFPFSIDRRAVPRHERGAESAGSGLLGELQELRSFQKDVMIALLSGKIGQSAAPASSADPIELATKIADIATRNSGGGVELLKAFREGMHLAGDRPAVPTDSMGALVQTAAPLFSALATRIQADNEQRRLAASTAPAPAPAPSPAPPPMSPAPAPSGPYAWLEYVRPYLPQLASMAETNRDPGVTVDFVLDNLPEALLDEMELTAKDARFVEEVIARVPEARMQREWFTRFLTELQKALLADEGAATNGQR